MALVFGICFLLYILWKRATIVDKLILKRTIIRPSYSVQLFVSQQEKLLKWNYLSVSGSRPLPLLRPYCFNIFVLFWGNVFSPIVFGWKLNCSSSSNPQYSDDQWDSPVTDLLKCRPQVQARHTCECSPRSGFVTQGRRNRSGWGGYGRSTSSANFMLT